MRSLVLFSLLFVVSFAHGDELMDAYQKEYAYLVAEKEAMSQRLQLQKQQQMLKSTETALLPFQWGISSQPQ